MSGLPAYATANIAATCNANAGATFSSPTGGFDATFTAANLIDGRQAKVTKSNGVIATIWDIRADLGAAGADTGINLVALCNHNFPATTTVEIQASTTGAFAGEQKEVQSVGTAVSLISSAFTFTEPGGGPFRYWRIIITPPAATIQGVIGELWIAVATQMTRQFAWPFKEGKRVKVIFNESVGGAIWVAQLMSGKRVYTLTWQDQKDADRDTDFTLLTSTAGTIFLFVLNSQNSTPTASLDQECVLGSTANDEMDFEREMYDINSGGQIKITEDAIGTGY